MKKQFYTKIISTEKDHVKGIHIQINPKLEITIDEINGLNFYSQIENLILKKFEEIKKVSENN